MISETVALTIRELRKWVRTPPLLFISLFQPLAWLALFGSAFNPTNLVPTNFGSFTLPPAIANQIKSQILSQSFQGAANYITFLTGGMLCFILLFSSAFSGAAIVWDRRFGFLNKLLAAPIPRSSIFFSKVFSSIIKGMVQALMIFFAALIIPNGLTLNSSFSVLDFLGVFFIMFLLAFAFSSLFTALAVRITKWESLIAIVNLLNLPLLFTSTALLPISSMPDWLQSIANVNPISKAAEVARFLIINGALTDAQMTTALWDFAYIGGLAIVFSVLGAWLSRIALRAQ